LQKLNNLWKVVNVASSVRDIVQHTKTYHFGVPGQLTFYLQTENAAITFTRWQRPMIEIAAKLQIPMGWNIGTDQDEMGVYMVAARRPVVGGFSQARFDVCLPHDTHIMLKIERCDLQVRNLSGAFQLSADQEYLMLPESL